LIYFFFFNNFQFASNSIDGDDSGDDDSSDDDSGDDGDKD